MIPAAQAGILFLSRWPSPAVRSRAHPRETQQMVFDAHERVFVFFKGACVRGVYDNMKTAVQTIFVGKDRQYSRRFLQMCSHHLVEPVACAPAACRSDAFASRAWRERRSLKDEELPLMETARVTVDVRLGFARWP